MPRLLKCEKFLREYPLNFVELKCLFEKNIHTRLLIDSLLVGKSILNGNRE